MKKNDINRKKMNLFEVDKKYYLAHCISVDHKMGLGIATEFNKKFKLENQFKLIEQSGTKINIGDAIFIGNTINLITKSKYYGKPTYQTLSLALIDMKETCELEEIKFVAMPKIGCGLDRLSWGKVREMLEETFKNMDIEILVCNL
jgi:hypothetical protein